MLKIEKLKPFFFLIAIVAITVAGAFLLTRGETPLANPEILTYYWGEGCPHCKNVDDFVNSWSGKDTVQIDKKEVWNSAANAKELTKRYKETCKVINPTEMGVPLLVTPDGKCLSGDVPIIDYYKSLTPTQ